MLTLPNENQPERTDWVVLTADKGALPLSAAALAQVLEAAGCRHTELLAVIVAHNLRPQAARKAASDVIAWLAEGGNERAKESEPAASSPAVKQQDGRMAKALLNRRNRLSEG